jgi:hypothetical protein
MVHGKKPECLEKGGEKNEKTIQDTNDTGITGRNMRYSEMVEIMFY